MNSTRTVLVTGAARGIGKAIAEHYSALGWRILAPNRAELDLADVDSIQGWLAQVQGTVDVLINNAGENPIQLIEQLELESWQRNLMVNLTGPMLLAQGLAKGMRAQRWGRIVNISSIFGVVSRSGRAPYASTKTGLIGLTRTSALEWAGDNVLVNALCPGYVETDLTRQNNTPEEIQRLCRALPIGRLAQPEEIARAVYFLGSDQNTFITGQTVVADGGFTAQ